MNVTKRLKFVLASVENIVVKGENAGNVFKRLLIQGCQKSGLCGKQLMHLCDALYQARQNLIMDPYIPFCQTSD